MKIKRIRVQNFKRFTDLTLEDLRGDARGVVLVGPNGNGKSCIFDAIEQVGGRHKQGGLSREADYLAKDPSANWSVEIEDTNGRKYGHNSGDVPQTFSYIRSSYRYTAEISPSGLGNLPEETQDHDRPKRMIDIDSRLITNYQRLFTTSIRELFGGKLDDMTGRQIREKYTSGINTILQRVLEIQISDIGDPLSGKGQLCFSKGASLNFPFKNLGSGEKEVVNMVFDLVLKSKVFSDTIICIDEPELHINTSIQAKLFEELLKMVPDTYQLWIATHSIGIIRRAVLEPSVEIIDFRSDFDSTITLRPISQGKTEFRSIFSVALDDLTELVLSETIVFCEGENSQADENFYRTVFKDKTDVEFIASTNKSTTKIAMSRLLQAIDRGLSPKRALAIVDLDGLTLEERKNIIGPSLRVLPRYSVENYALAPEVLRRVCDRTLNLDEYKTFIREKVNLKLDAIRDDVRKSRDKDTLTKNRPRDHPLLNNAQETSTDSFDDLIHLVPGKQLVGEVLQRIKEKQLSTKVAQETNTSDFMNIIAENIQPGMDIYQELEQAVFD